MQSTYSGFEIENCSNEELKTQLSHLSHDLDKTISTLAGLPEFEKIAGRESANLSKILTEWERRGEQENQTVVWANELITEARALIRNPNAQEEFSRASENNWVGGDKTLFEIIKSRRSIRSWATGKIPNDVIEKLIEAATWAPSACNRQSVRYIVLQDDEQRMSLVSLREKFLGRAPLLIFIGADKRNYYPEEVNIVPYLDAAVASQNLLLMAHSMGLGAVFVKCTNVDIKMDTPWSGGQIRKKAILEMYSKLNLPDHFMPVAIIGLGYPKRTPPPPPRLPRSDVLYFEKAPASSSAIIAQRRKLTQKTKMKLSIIKTIHRVVRRLGIRIYVTLEE
jgi:nitroreductase